MAKTGYNHEIKKESEVIQKVGKIMKMMDSGFASISKNEYEEQFEIIKFMDLIDTHPDIEDLLSELADRDKSSMDVSELEACAILIGFIKLSVNFKGADEYQAYKRHVLNRSFTDEDIPYFMELVEGCQFDCKDAFEDGLLHILYLQMYLLFVEAGIIEVDEDSYLSLGVLLDNAMTDCELSCDYYLVDNCRTIGEDLLSLGEKFLGKDRTYDAAYEILKDHLAAEIVSPFVGTFKKYVLINDINFEHLFENIIYPISIFDAHRYLYVNTTGYDEWRSKAISTLISVMSKFINRDPKDEEIFTVYVASYFNAKLNELIDDGKDGGLFGAERDIFDLVENILSKKSYDYNAAYDYLVRYYVFNYADTLDMSIVDKYIVNIRNRETLVNLNEFLESKGITSETLNGLL